ncbi:MAG: Zn-dependent protease [Myxococcota bacterium]|jgi:Zn-dependent protease
MSAPAKPAGTIQLFVFRGIHVYVHWSWLIVGVIALQLRSDAYTSVAWNVAEYLLLFAIVLLHEFGHALACRSVGGQAERILLWPLGGIAYVRPPQRPGAQLWSLFAGPLVNLVLAPLGLGLLVLWSMVGVVPPDAESVLITFVALNVGLFVFNMLPIYPLDGGQILRSFLWFAVGRERSLTIAAGLGLVTSIVGGLAAAIWMQSLWIGLIALYAASQSWQGLRSARASRELRVMPRHTTLHCPSCRESPLAGPHWICPEEHAFDIFLADGACPQCAAPAPATRCIFCGSVHPVAAYRT